jgi:multidrug efflux system outer membrane protein
LKAVAKFAPRFATVLAALLLSACAAPGLPSSRLSTPAAFKESQTAAPAPRLTQCAAPPTAAPGSSRSRPKASRAANGGAPSTTPALDSLIAQATASNQNLSVAAARVKQARAIAGIAEADRIPQVGVGVGAQRARLSPLEANVAPGTPIAPATSYKAPAERQLRGRPVRPRLQQRGGGARRCRRGEATYRSVLLSLQADVAQTYFRLRSLDAELATVNQTVRLREESVRVTGRRFELGDIGEFDLSRAKTELATARAEAIGLQRQRATSEHALAVLLGQPASNFGAASDPLEANASLPLIPAGLPSALLERRPDIASAQRTMEAANARIGVARSPCSRR